MFSHPNQIGWTFPPDGMLREINQTALDLEGLTYEDVSKRPFWQARQAENL